MNVDIRRVKDMNGLITYLAEKLSWRIDLDDFEDIEDIAYDFEAEDIGLKEEAFVKIQSLRQLPPLVDGQKWGIFCVEFDSKRFEVTALRKILSGLIPKRRNSADHAVWDQKDLLFICFWGSNNERTIGLAHFEAVGSGLPQIKMISCCPAVEDFTQIKVFEDRLKKLKWPTNYMDHAKWQEDWSSAFTTSYKQTIHDASTLTVQLAEEAQGIKQRILDIFTVETANGYVHLLYEKFKDTLIHDMSKTQFADMYAQTVVYGLFSARCMDNTQEDFSAAEAVDCIPNTNPFLKSLMRECLGTQNNSKLSFDELEIGNVVDLLLHTKTDSIIQDFNRQTGGGREDPVIHFYEEFLTAYDKSQKVQRGVYYTPQPVVNFMVRSVDSIIKKDFGIPDGLASTESKKIKIFRQSKKRYDGFHYRTIEDTEEVPAIQVLDPATGTGTFLRQIILQIYENFQIKNRGMSAGELKKAWNDYVPRYLLPRLNGFELMMAPYAVAHMKLAMVLKDTGYDFGSSERLNVFLSNTLEEPGTSDRQLTIFDDPLATESIAANAVKKNEGVNIIIGNPPYSGISSNNNSWIAGLIDTYKYTDGVYFNERKHWLNDDYVKFIRFSHLCLDATEKGIVALITPHGYIDNPTFRAMRWNLMKEFDKIYVLNLHGNINRKEKTPDGGKDENVFDIQQGVSISLFIKQSSRSKECKVFYADLYGTRDEKYRTLNSSSIESIKWKEANPADPFYLFKPSAVSKKDNYENGFKLTDLFCEYTAGVITARDGLAIDFSKSKLLTKIETFVDTTKTDDQIRDIFWPGKKAGKYLPGDSRGWSLSKCRVQIAKNDHKNYIRLITYRPFDWRYIYYSPSVIDWGREKVLSSLYPPNIALISARSNKSGRCDHFYITEHIAEAKCGESTTQSTVFPLYVDDENKMFRKPNLSTVVLKKFGSQMGLPYKNEKVAKGISDAFGPYDIIYYIYAIMFSSVYRESYKEKLVLDFPVIPCPESADYFWSMVKLGFRLEECHTMKIEGRVDTNFILSSKDEDNIVEKYKFQNGSIEINRNQRFHNITNEDWDFSIGGYQPLQKWLKDRKGYILSQEDVVHYERIIYCIRLTREIMKEIDTIVRL